MDSVKDTKAAITIDESGYPAEILIDGEAYSLLCEYDDAHNINRTIKVYLKEGGNDVVVNFGDGTACVGRYFVIPNKVNELLDYIEATISLKSGFDTYCVEDLQKCLETATDKYKGYPIIQNELQSIPTKSPFVKLFHRLHQSRAFAEHFSKSFDGTSCVISDGALKGASEPEHPDGASEHNASKESAELKAIKEPFCLGEFNVLEIMSKLAGNAWLGLSPTTVYLSAGDNVIEINGYVYEPGYEYFSSTSSISFNGQILYGQDSRNVEAYHNEVYQTGLYDTLEAAILHINGEVKGHEFVMCSEPPQVEQLILEAVARSEQSKSPDEQIKTQTHLDITK